MTSLLEQAKLWKYGDANAVSDVDGHVLIAEYSAAVLPDWAGLKAGLMANTSIMMKTISTANPNAYTTLQQAIRDENAELLALAWQLLGVSWTAAELTAIRGILTDNRFNADEIMGQS